MTTIIFVLLGIFIGGGIADEEGVVAGLFIGLAFGMIANLKGRVFKLEQELARTMDSVKTTHFSKESPESEVESIPERMTDTLDLAQATQAEPISFSEPPVAQTQLDTKDSGTEIKRAAQRQDNTSWSEPAQQADLKQSPSKPDFAQKVFFALRDFFTKGNVVVKVGAIVLFFGVAFLLKYAAERSLFPIELRLLSVIAVGISLLLLGWRLRKEKLEYGLILQGAGMGMLYITIFAASKLYHVFPASFSMVMMLVLVVLTGVLAIQQNAKSLALFGIVGGFLAPILMSTGSGSHITLFSYYALLNLGIFGIAWFKSWRILNLVGFIFTFAISGAWGFKAYQSEFFLSTEVFLILFYFFYLIISIMFAFKQKPELKGYVDGSLVFGLPLIVFALQSKLVEQFEYGQAITAVAMAGIYFTLAKQLWQPEKNGFRLLAESFLALGVTFASLAIPLYFDGRWTAAVWSLEGAALVWIGLKQSHFVPRVFGLLLSVGAGLIFIASIEAKLSDSIAIINSAYIGMVLVSLSGLFIAYLYERNKVKAYSFELTIAMFMVFWGLIWWFYAGLNEIDRYVAHQYDIKVFILFMSVSVFIQTIAHHKLNWAQITLPVCLFMPAVVLFMLVDFVNYHHINPLEFLGYLAWPSALFVHLLVLRRKGKSWSEWMKTTWHAVGVMSVAFLVTWIVSHWVDSIANLSDIWVISTIGSVLALFSWSLIRWGYKLNWPVMTFPRAYYSLGLLPLMVALVFWQLIASEKNGHPGLFAYVPLLNPLDLVQALAIAVMVYWLWFINKTVENKWLSIPSTVIGLTAGLMSFSWVNVVIARSVHHFAHINYASHSMIGSSVFQTSTSIVWSILAMMLMAMALRRSSRNFWFAGAGLLVLVVLKLFFVDLADSGSISRIISFLVVGALMLVIGYLSPLPPKIEVQDIKI